MIERSLVAVVALVGAASVAEGRDCRVPEAPPGIRVQAPVGCEARVPPPARRPKPDAGLKASRQPGFIDLGNGSQLRIGGRVRVDGLTRD
jgi:hypothetical protein